MTKQMHWHPWTKNPLDYLDQPMVQTNGDTWEVTMNMRGWFVIKRNGEQLHTTDNNINVCFWLNVAEVKA